MDLTGTGTELGKIYNWNLNEQKVSIPQIKTEYAKKNMKEISHPSEGYINKKNVSDQIMV